MRITLISPVNPAAVSDLLSVEDGQIAKDQPVGTGTAPGLLARALVRRGHDVTLVTHRRGHASLDLTGENFRLVQVESRTRQRHQLKDCWAKERALMAHAVIESRPDVVHAHWAYEWGLAATKTGLPTVLTVRDAPLTVVRYTHDVYRMVRLLMPYRIRFGKQPDVVTAVSPYLASKWRRQTLSGGYIHVIPNSAPSDITQIGPKSDSPLVVEVSDAGRRKNIPLLLLAFAKVRENVPNAELRIIGPGLDEGGFIARDARRHGLAAGVHFLGTRSRSEINHHLSEAWVHAHVSLEETFGNTIVEAMCCRAVVVGGDKSGAVPWILGNGEYGVVADMKSPDSVASAIMSVLQDNDMREQLSVAAHNSLARFSEESVVTSYLEVYRKAVNLARNR
ncbi:glycosyltransferase [Rhodococcus rhodochrous]|uniref:glycosyltransferase n=1 Tax=Rhodococcus rhodochrous TaxID=1829 RepID=UPI001329B4F3|nr:glycosyltransferase family 4 protein [Rhodococcus pyridinivorans]MXQ75095.1 glycosyltransferase [Rhodococcus rhodochrous]